MIWIGLVIAACAALTICALIVDARTRGVYCQLWLWIPLSLLLPPFAASLYLLAGTWGSRMWRSRVSPDQLRMPQTRPPDTTTFVVNSVAPHADDQTRANSRRSMWGARCKIGSDAALLPVVQEVRVRSIAEDVVVAVQDGTDAGQIIWLPVNGAVIVRRGWPGEAASPGQLLLADARVSRDRHCVISRTAAALRVEDCSTYGTVVDGQRICGASVPASVGSLLVVGSTRLMIGASSAGLQTVSLIQQSD